MQQHTKSTTYHLASYSRAHDYEHPHAGSTQAQWKDQWIHSSLCVVLDEVTTQGSSAPTILRLRVLKSSSAPYNGAPPSNSPYEIHEDLDLTMFQRLLRDSPSRKVMEQNGYPIRAAYRGTQVIFRYQYPIHAPPSGTIAYRRFQIVFASASDVPAFVSAIGRVCHCSDHNSGAKTSRNRGGTSIYPASKVNYDSNRNFPPQVIVPPQYNYPPSSQQSPFDQPPQIPTPQPMGAIGGQYSGGDTYDPSSRNPRDWIGPSQNTYPASTVMPSASKPLPHFSHRFPESQFDLQNESQNPLMLIDDYPPASQSSISASQQIERTRLPPISDLSSSQLSDRTIGRSSGSFTLSNPPHVPHAPNDDVDRFSNSFNTAGSSIHRDRTAQYQQGVNPPRNDGPIAPSLADVILTSLRSNHGAQLLASLSDTDYSSIITEVVADESFEKLFECVEKQLKPGPRGVDSVTKTRLRALFS